MATLAPSFITSGCREGRDALGNDATTAREAFAAIVDRNAELLYRVAHTVLRQPQDAEDAVQDALLKLYRTGAWREMKNERAFLARTVWCVALDRYNGRPPLAESLDDAESAAARTVAVTGPSPEAGAMESDEYARLHAVLDGLPMELRAPLLLSAIEDMTTREIAVALALNEATVRTRIHRARGELKRRLMAQKGVRR